MGKRQSPFKRTLNIVKFEPKLHNNKMNQFPKDLPKRTSRKNLITWFSNCMALFLQKVRNLLQKFKTTTEIMKLGQDLDVGEGNPIGSFKMIRVSPWVTNPSLKLVFFFQKTQKRKELKKLIRLEMLKGWILKGDIVEMFVHILAPDHQEITPKL